MFVRTKICGIQTLDEANMCINAGAHAIGFLIGLTHKAEDKIIAGECRAIVSKLPPIVSTVMVTHLTLAVDIIPLVAESNVNTLQLHDDLPYKQILRIKTALPFLKIIKCVHVIDSLATCLAKASAAAMYADAILLDSRTQDRLGGTGMTHDWNISATIREKIKVPLILAGGLGPHNVAEAIEKVRPYAVDVNSGVENIAGGKDPEKVRLFVERSQG